MERPRKANTHVSAAKNEKNIFKLVEQKQKRKKKSNSHFSEILTDHT